MKTAYFSDLEHKIATRGGKFNAHLHLDRFNTFQDRYMKPAGIQVLKNSHISLHRKHALIESIHAGPAYHEDDLRSRVNNCLDIMVACGTTRADTLTDTTADNLGTSALETMLSIKRERADDIDLRVAAYSPLGFTDREPERWKVFRAGAEKADFISALPEADDQNEYPENIGFDEHCRRTLELAVELDLPIHVHTDQRNEPGEDGTERLIKAVRKYGGPRAIEGEPRIWAVHMISPSTYDEVRYQKLLDGLLECEIGVICCPSAAIGMRQLRAIPTPTYNSIPRVLEMLAAGVFVRVACDNIADLCSPSTTPDLTDELFVLSAAVRFYDTDILASLGAGKQLSSSEREFIRNHLAENDREIEKVIRQSRATTF